MRRRFGSRLEIALSAGLLLWAVLEALLIPSAWPLGVRLAFALVATAPLLVRHRHPFAVFAWTGAALTLDGLVTFLPFTAVTPLEGVAVGAYAVAVYGRPRRRAGIVLLGSLVAMPALFGLSEREVAATPHDVMVCVVMMLLAASAGWAVRSRHEEAERAAAQTDSSGAADARRLRRDLAAERRRIARELHAIVARDLAAIARLAADARARIGGGAGAGSGAGADGAPAASGRAGATDERGALAALSEISRTTTAALDELRRLLHVLRAEELFASAEATAAAPRRGDGVEPAPIAGGRPRLDRTVDLLIGGLALTALAIEQLPHGSTLGWASGVALVVAPLALARRRAALAVAAVLVLGGLLARTALGWMPPAGLTLVAVIVFAPYAAAAHARQTRLAIAGGVLVALVALLTVALLTPDSAPTDLPIVACVVAISWLAGWHVRGSSSQAFWQRAERRRLAETAPERRRAALEAERTRVARDLHDVVANGVSLIGLLAAGARATLPRDPRRARQALADLDDAVASTHVELARLLEALRAGDEPAADAASLEDLTTLARRARRAGQPVALAFDRETLAAAPAGVLASACRIVQEALTNARKHAGGAPVDVRLRLERGALLVDVRNAPPPRPCGSGAGARRGIEGMRERARLLDGELEAAPTGDGGFRVRARLPCAAEPAPQREPALAAA